jgi:hypothetical protein
MICFAVNNNLWYGYVLRRHPRSSLAVGNVGSGESTLSTHKRAPFSPHPQFSPFSSTAFPPVVPNAQSEKGGFFTYDLELRSALYTDKLNTGSSAMLSTASLPPGVDGDYEVRGLPGLFRPRPCCNICSTFETQFSGHSSSQ